MCLKGPRAWPANACAILADAGKIGQTVKGHSLAGIVFITEKLASNGRSERKWPAWGPSCLVTPCMDQVTKTRWGFPMQRVTAHSCTHNGGSSLSTSASVSQPACSLVSKEAGSSLSRSALLILIPTSQIRFSVDMGLRCYAESDHEGREEQKAACWTHRIAMLHARDLWIRVWRRLCNKEG